MKITKASQGGEYVEVKREDLELINQLSRKELNAEEVYTFSVRLCDNEVDRDGERFSTETLGELAELFVGKSGIFDHQWSASGQAARIYKTELVQEPEKMTRAGDGYCWLKGYAYMVRTDSTKDLICEIEAGIKKEVSVGCAVERSVCSVCGTDLRQGDCGHRKGEVYDGQLCFVSLEGARDAYEFSFVAVPAQPMAGVVKSAAKSGMTLKELAAEHGDCLKELERLEEEAVLGRQYLTQLRGEVLRLGLLADIGLDREVLKTMTDKLSAWELMAMKDAYGSRAAKRYPIRTQLEYGEKTAEPEERDRAFLI
jgi:hypothetical protein